MNEKMKRLYELTDILNYHTNLYNSGKTEITDTEWDNLYFELVELEKELKVSHANSPTKKIIFEEPLDHLNKITHDEYPMLSLDKTKDPEVIKSFEKGNYEVITMLKLDGLSCRLLYQGGRLIQASTRGNGEIGEDITHNVMVMDSVPKTISTSGTIIIDGEIICKTDVFEKYFADEYKNPRNFTAGSIRLLDAKESHKRRLTFVAWDVVQGMEYLSYLSEKLLDLEGMGFITTPWTEGLNEDNNISIMTNLAKKLNFPIDGLVYKYDDVEYYRSLGATAHHPLGAMAFKFTDEVVETSLLDIQWTMGRTGVLTPVAIFETVDLEGTEVSRASLHNLTILRELLGKHPYVGQKLEVYKANQIIPQIKNAEKNDNEVSKNCINLEAFCPECGEMVELVTENDSTMVYCTNPNCSGKLLNRLDHFCSKKGLDIKGLSSATLQKLIELEWVEEPEDIFDLVQHYDEWSRLSGFGPKSVQNILHAIEEARNCTLEAFISSLGIPLVGVNVAKELCKYFKTWEEFITAVEGEYQFWKLDGFGEEKHYAIKNFDYTEAKKVAIRLKFKYNNNTEKTNDAGLNNLTFVITGSLNNFKNRDELKKVIEVCGGKVAGSVSGKTSYLINNDVNSTSSKNATARRLNIPIISEREFIEKFMK